MKTTFLKPIGFLCSVVLSVAGSGYAASTPKPPPPKPVPDMQVIPLPYQQVSFQHRGAELARYYFGPDLRRPFVFPVIGPSGRSLTRMGHPHDPETHSHHNSVWISHHDVNGISFWGDKGKGRIIHQRIERLEDGPEEALVRSRNAWTTDEGKVLLQEVRQTSARWLRDGEWMLLIDLRLDAKDGEVTLGKTPFGLIGVRMAKTIGVHDGGGTIRNSEGGVNEAGCFWKRARWVDYSGPITSEATEGITLMDHPGNANHPTVFHVRDDGWMGASLTHEAPRVLKARESLRLRYGLYVHAGKPEASVLEKQWEVFVQIPLPELR